MSDIITRVGGVMADDGARFMQSGSNSGRWANQRFLEALNEGRWPTAKELRTAEVLRNEEWKFFDTEVIREAQLRLRGVGDLIAAGLFKRIPNSMAKTVYQYDKGGDMDPAIVSLDGVSRSENDRIEYTAAGLPLPITHKDWYLNLRMLAASRLGGEPLDTTYSAVAGRKVADETERMLFRGGKTFAGLTIYGYTTHPDRNTVSFGTGGSWTGAKTGDQILTDVLTMIGLMEGDRQYGPFWLYIASNMSLKLNEDFKAASDKTIRDRLMEIEQLDRIAVADQLPASTAVLVQPSAETVQMLLGEDIQNIQWDTHGGFMLNFKVFQIAVPLIRSDIANRSGIVHMS
jgi:uncharacterized linocin/CFP29 family protein